MQRTTIAIFAGLAMLVGLTVSGQEVFGKSDIIYLGNLGSLETA